MGRAAGAALVLAHALANRGTVVMLRGDLKLALKIYEECLGVHSNLGHSRERAGVMSNVAAIWLDYGDFGQSARLQREAVAELHACGELAWMNLAIAHANLCRALLEDGDLRGATTARLAAAQAADAGAYARGKAYALLLAAEIAALENHQASATRGALAALAAYEALGIEESHNYEVAARVFRLAGDLSGAAKFVDKALELSRGYQIEYAAALVEGSLVAEGTGASELAKQRRIDARVIYVRCGAELRAARLA